MVTPHLETAQEVKLVGFVASQLLTETTSSHDGFDFYGYIKECSRCKAFHFGQTHKHTRTHTDTQKEN